MSRFDVLWIPRVLVQIHGNVVQRKVRGILSDPFHLATPCAGNILSACLDFCKDVEIVSSSNMSWNMHVVTHATQSYL